jgi:hypothetical protein
VTGCWRRTMAKVIASMLRDRLLATNGAIEA